MHGERKMISHQAEEILESLWVRIEEKKENPVPLYKLDLMKNDPVVNELLGFNLVVLNDENIIFTENGKAEGRNVVRRHRLAERLLLDVLGVKGDLLNQAACQFEHILYKGIDDKICTLLGHPKICPHGHDIPAGKCCEHQKIDIRIIFSLSQLKPGQKGKIAYIQADEQNKLQKMMMIGVLPGTEIVLLQNFPSFLFKVGNSQFVVDETIASSIFVRVGE